MPSCGLRDRFNYRLHVLKDDLVFEPQDLDSQALDKHRALCLILLSEFAVVWSSIQLDRNVTFHAEKVDDIAANAVLPTKLLPEDLAPLETFPQNRLGCCGVVPQFPTPGFQRRDVELGWLVFLFP